MGLLSVLGLRASGTAIPVSPPGRFVPATQQLPERGYAVLIGQGRPRSNAVIAPPVPLPKPPQEFDGEGGKKIEVGKRADGRIVYTAPPPKVDEITFSGGGGKGTALPGAVKATPWRPRRR